MSAFFVDAYYVETVDNSMILPVLKKYIMEYESK